MAIVDVCLALSDWDENERNTYKSYINYKLYNKNNGMLYESEISISPQEAILIGTKLIEAAIPMLAEEDWNELRNDKRKAK